jgi:nucleotide-binding universal stress UspA family protein
MARVIEADPVDALVDVARETGAHVIAVGARGAIAERAGFESRTIRSQTSRREPLDTV